MTDDGFEIFCSTSLPVDSIVLIECDDGKVIPCIVKRPEDIKMRVQKWKLIEGRWSLVSDTVE